jgi:hypothetical protein
MLLSFWQLNEVIQEKFKIYTQQTAQQQILHQMITSIPWLQAT